MNLWNVKVIENSILSGRASGGTTTTLVDDKKNMSTDLFKDKLIKIIVEGIEYVRKITSHTVDTFTFDALVSAVAATAVLDNTSAGGGKVTITADPAGTYANDYKVVVVKGEGANASTEASFDEGVLTITLGTGAGAKATATIGTLGTNGIVVTANEIGVLDGYSIEITQNSGEDVPLSTGYSEELDKFVIGLGTDASGDPDDSKNTVANIVNALNDNVYFNALFIAASTDGSGVHNTPIAAVDIEGGAEPAVDGAAAEVKTAIEGISEGPFTVVADTAGVMVVTEAPIDFSGGVDEVKPAIKSEYFVI
jgi:hypothetical protein